jgi:hypothetical protein
VFTWRYRGARLEKNQSAGLEVLKGHRNPEIRQDRAHDFLPPLQHLQPGGPGVFPTRRYEVTPYEGETLHWTGPRVETRVETLG